MRTAESTVFIERSRTIDASQIGFVTGPQQDVSGKAQSRVQLYSKPDTGTVTQKCCPCGQPFKTKHIFSYQPQ